MKASAPMQRKRKLSLRNNDYSVIFRHETGTRYIYTTQDGDLPEMPVVTEKNDLKIDPMECIRITSPGNLVFTGKVPKMARKEAKIA